MDDNEKKRKRELGIESDQQDAANDAPIDVEQEKPGQGLRKNKKQKFDSAADAQDDVEEARRAAKADKRKEKRQSKKEKVEKVKQKQEAKKSRKQPSKRADGHDELADDDDDENDDDDDGDEVTATGDLDAMDFSGLTDGNDEAHLSDAESSNSTPDQDSSVFDASANQSGTSSSSSIVPAPGVPAAKASKDAAAKPKKEKALKLPEVDAEELQSRLRTRIEELRARRKADGPNGQPAKSRQELLETRRKKEEARKQHKKELRVKAKQDEERQNNDRLRGSGSPLSTDIFSPLPVDENNFAFGRVAFEDGHEADAGLTTIAEHKKRKGPQDTRAALQAAEKKAARLAGYDSETRADIEEKDLWLNAKKKAHGERLKDDQSLLKKALKRKEKIKTKSATSWNERSESVRKGKEMKDKKRETNLAKRRDEKGQKGGKKGASKKGGSSGGSKKGRPGFEGRFKA